MTVVNRKEMYPDKNKEILSPDHLVHPGIVDYWMHEVVKRDGYVLRRPKEWR